MKLVLLSFVVAGTCLAGQIIRDGTVGPAGALPGPDFVIPDTDGTTRGNNLFHSFSQFDLGTGESATFTGPENILNILARVTGHHCSTIDGTIDTTGMPNANFFFINPFGVVFRENAQINVSGSLAVTTADYVKLGDRGRFDARNPANDVLTADPPSAFGFLGPSGGSITMTGIANPDDPSILTFLPDGKNLWLVGGDVTISGYLLGAPGGEFVGVATASRGELPVNLDDSLTPIDTSTFSQLGALTIEHAAGPYVAGEPAGRVVLEADRILMSDNSGITASNYGDTTGGGVSLIGRMSIELTDGSIGATAFANGDSGDLVLTAPVITLTGFSIGAGSAGNGRAGSISITASEFSIFQSGGVNVQASSTGAGGNLVVTADHIRIEGQGVSTPSLNASTRGAPAGNIIVQAQTIELLTGGEIISDTVRGAARGGDIQITADRLVADGGGVSQLTGISSRSVLQSTGGGGNIVLDIGLIELHRSAQITATSTTAGPGGSVFIHGADLVVDGGSAIACAATADGTAGSISLNLSGSLLLRSGGRLSVSSAASNGGNIDVNVGSSLRLVHGEISARAGSDGGNVHLIAPGLVYLRDSRITAEADHDGGNVTIDPHFVVLNNSPINTSAGNNGGNITILSDFVVASPSLSGLLVATGKKGVNGTITITGPDVDLSGSLLPLDTDPLDERARLLPHCSVRLPGGVSTFVVTGRSAAPVEPDSLLPALPPRPGDQ